VGPLLGGRVALVTGGAGAIGAATCVRLAEHGADVAVADHDADRVAATVARVEERGRRAIGVVGDLTPDGAARSAVERTIAELGRVDVLVNGLGEHLALGAPFETTDPAGWEALYRVNLRHVLEATHAAVPGMKERGWGRVVSFSSVEGIRAMPFGAPYTAFKGAIDSFTKSLGVELAPSGIRVNAIAVDKTRAHQTGFYDLGAEYDRHVPVWIPAGRYAEGDDVASVVLFLASDLCDWVVGQTIVADGGTLSAGGWYRTPQRWTNSPLLVQWVEDDPAGNAARPRSVQ
jgi:NAD(P)-dependent dehydrogenase (short-subunit alcohol dehydrogenase family)